jgi:hypothetical protein
MEYLILIPAFILIITGTGILFLTKRGNFEKILTIFNSKKPEISSSPITTIAIWKLRFHGIFHLWLAAMIILGLLCNRLFSNIPLIIWVLPLIAIIILTFAGLFFSLKRIKPRTE